ncbi:N-sulphoglucosamine sulphohydrolase [Luminiphilus syltensis NOR5-1B]|uniref:N-sulphoglucosamine sulphohydrolase n=1 Tax=Luminiphilus syltensis NOR5-1B TaxID=565045 RepID=B8KV75_9GAMM|nr:sulfatase-like hydrolase/transferase [Luminiphilus syltensis]EED34700.1 N-sulphoglucosamine sulphohydrolase [Luminiphilus syltensis NOR5-1B]
MILKTILQCLVGVIYLMAVIPCVAADPGNTRPNVVVIVVDNVPAKLIGAYGNKYVETPHIDELAREGMTMDHAFASSGVCSPTRATLLTGLLPSQTGVQNALPSDVGLDGWSAIGEFRSLPQTFSDAGYRTGLVGKYHLGVPDEPQLKFDSWVTFASGHTSSWHDVEVIDNEKTYKTQEHLTDFWSKKAVEFIDRQSESRPFFLYLSYNGPYMLPPLVLESAKNRYADYYRANPVPMPHDSIHPFLQNLVTQAVADSGGGGEFLKGWRAEESGHKSRWSEVAWGMVSALNNPEALVHAISELTMVDEGVGTVLASIRENGLDQNTVVIFTSDQGSALGEHGLWGNSSAALPTTAYEENMHIPLIIRHIGKIEEGSRNDELINQFDLAPTVLDYVGMADKEFTHSPGRSFSPVLEGETVDSSGPVFFEYMRTRAIRTRDWKLIARFPDGPNEVYNLRTDPGEYQNLADIPEYSEIQKSLGAQLQAFFDEYANPEFDSWRGGSGKAVMEYGDRNQFYKDFFSNWKSPSVSLVPEFSD